MKGGQWADTNLGTFQNSSRFNVTTRLLLGRKTNCVSSQTSFFRHCKLKKRCSINRFTDNRATFGSIGAIDYFLKLWWSLTFLLSRRHEAEDTYTGKSRVHAYLILVQSWRLVDKFAPSLPQLPPLVAPQFALVALLGHSWSACAQRRSRQVTSGYYCTVHRGGEENVLFNLVSGRGSKCWGIKQFIYNLVLPFEVSQMRLHCLFGRFFKLCRGFTF